MGKTERECVKEAVKMLKKAGYKPFDSGESYEPVSYTHLDVYKRQKESRGTEDR